MSDKNSLGDLLWGAIRANGTPEQKRFEDAASALVAHEVYKALSEKATEVDKRIERESLVFFLFPIIFLLVVLGTAWALWIW